MKSKFVADGRTNLCDSNEFQERLRKLRASIEARHAIALSHAGLFRRCLLRLGMQLEYIRESRRLGPSPEALF
ncbi:MAG: hypothetical protein ACM3U2_06425 [Deltaproteobacteria bacterium]